MVYIDKDDEPLEFSQWKTEHQELLYNSLVGPPKRILKEALILEQKRICCYCECRISESSSHIEHFKPKDQNQFPNLQLTYKNLHASCIKENNHDSKIHCGHRKGNEYNDNLISPLEPDCSSHFKYTLEGHIEAIENDERATETIRILHLDSTLLNEQRLALLNYFEDIDEPNNKQQEIGNHLDNEKAVLGEFYTMIDYLKDRL